MYYTLTSTKWFLNEDGPATGKEYTVEFSPSTGVNKIVSVFAVVKNEDTRIDITLAEVEGMDLDALIEGIIDWDEVYNEDRYYNNAVAIVRLRAKSYRS